MDLATITIADFKARFYRDFLFYDQQTDRLDPAPPPSPKYIQDIDIQAAFADAGDLLNQALFGGDDEIKRAYLLLTAHCLVGNIRASVGGGAAFPMSARSVGSVSESYAVPAAYADNPALAMFTGTAYGLRYLQIVLPRLVGNVVAIDGGTNP